MIETTCLVSSNSKGEGNRTPTVESKALRATTTPLPNTVLPRGIEPPETPYSKYGAYTNSATEA